MRGLWIVDAEGERVVWRFERRAVVLCSLEKQEYDVSKGSIERGGGRLEGRGMEREVCTSLLFLSLVLRFWPPARCSRSLVFEYALRGGRIVLLVRRLGFGGFWCWRRGTRACGLLGRRGP